MLLPPAPFARLLLTAALLPIGFGATAGHADLYAYQISGTIDGTNVYDQLGGGYFASGSIPFGTTVPFTLTFTLDDSAPSPATPDSRARYRASTSKTG